METSVCRYDFAAITGTETTEEGYLKVWAKAARTGTQAYTRADGSRVLEYRPPSEVSNPDSLNTFGMKPATWGHPPSLLNTENTKQYQIGYTGSQVRYNDGFVEVAIVLTDKDSIEKVKRGDAREVSAGYRVDFDPTPGETPEGEKYVGVQRKIRVNHIAVVPRGRAGSEVRLLMDRMDAADAVSTSEQTSQPTQPQLSKPMASITLDGLELDLPVEAASAIQSHLREVQRRLDASEAERTSLSERCDSLAGEIETLAYEKEQAEERATNLQARVDEAPSEARLDQAQIDELVAKRLDTLRHLAPAFEEDFKFDGIEDEALFRQAFTNLTGSEPREDAEPAYINGVVDGLLSRLDEEDASEEEAPEEVVAEEPARADSTVELREALSSTQRPSTDSSTTSYRARMADAWKQPLTASK
jgi:hypothetical protein